MIRHGQTDYNLNNCVQGRGIDSSLNATGLAQAAKFFDAYQHVSFDKVYTSSLKRTQESVKGFLDLGCAQEPLDGLDEISWGHQEGKPYDATLYKVYQDTITGWANGKLNTSVGGGETPLEVVARQKAAMQHIMSQTNEETILIATHGRAMRIMICWMLNYPLSQMDAFEHTNLCLYQLHTQGDSFKIVKYADVTHLD